VAHLFRSLPASFLFSLALRLFFGAAARFFFRNAASMFGCQPLSFFGRTPPSFSLGAFARILVSLAFSFRLSAHLRFDLSTKLHFLFGPAASFRFSLTTSFLFSAATLSFLRQQASLFDGFQARILAQADAQDFFFDGRNPRLGAPAKLVFLGSFARLGIEIAPLFFSA
jgi:hypothetical protein